MPKDRMIELLGDERPTRALAEVEGWRRAAARPSLSPPGAPEAARRE